MYLFSRLASQKMGDFFDLFNLRHLTRASFGLVNGSLAARLLHHLIINGVNISKRGIIHETNLSNSSEASISR